MLADHGAVLDAVSKVSANGVGGTGWTVLNDAVEAGHLEVVCLLVDRGAALETANKACTAKRLHRQCDKMYSAALRGLEHIVALLADRGARWTGK